MNDFDALMADLAAGNWVHGIREDVNEKLQECAQLCFELNSLPPSRVAERDALVRRILGRVGKRYVLHSPFRCDFGRYISIGENFTGNFNLTILDEAPVTIGDRVFIGPNVSIYTIIHAITPDERNAGLMTAHPVTIGNDVWICGDVKILPGVTIGDGAVIAAGSVVREDVPPLTLAAGNPARLIRSIDPQADKVGK